MAGPFPQRGVSGPSSSSGGLDRVRAPYTFVPMSEHVFCPPWADAASQDVPFEDGVCGTLDVEIATLSPLFIRGAKDPKTFYETPDRTFAIPGTSIRGAVRNVVEIATFSRLHRINDTRFAVRDLQNRDLYGKHMAEIIKGPDGKGIPVPLVNAGWLIPATHDEVARGIGAWIMPCDFAKMHYRDIQTLALKRGIRDFEPGEKQSSAKKYGKWLDASRATNPSRLSQMEVQFNFRELRPKDEAKNRVSNFGKAQLPTVGQVERVRKGHLVFTGQPSRWTPAMNENKKPGSGNPKQHDFVFFNYLHFADRAAELLPVTVEALDDFEQIHADGAQQHKTTLAPNPEWGVWRDSHIAARGRANLELGETLDRPPESTELSVRFTSSGGRWYLPVEEFVKHRADAAPVFFLSQRKRQPKEILDKRREYTVLKETFVRSFGLAMMFRLAYAHSVRDGRGVGHRIAPAPEGVEPSQIPPKLDFAEALFGHVPMEPFERTARGDRALLKGRVSFETARRTAGEAGPRVGPVVLSAPKASFYPNYIEQRTTGNDAGQPPMGEWQTYQDDNFRLRGWKRYRPLDATIVPPRPKEGGVEFDDKKMEKLGTTFTPIKRGATFTTRLHLHNVKLAELGAVLWALDFGGRGATDASDRPRHVMGLGRSIGYGQVQFRIKGGTVLPNNEAAGAPEFDAILRKAEAAFVEEMERFAQPLRGLGGWESSRQIYELIESARPMAAADGRHMQIDHPDNGNEFVATKKAKRVLAPAGTTPGWKSWETAHPAPKLEAAPVAGASSTAASRPVAPGPVPADRKPWARHAPGTQVRGRLVGVTGNGNWKVELVEWQANGTVFGKAPKGAYLNDVVELVISDGTDAKAIKLKWV